MRKFVHNILPWLLLSLTTVGSCGKTDPIENVAWKEVFLRIALRDESGNELFNPEDKVHFIGDEITGIEYQGKLYSLEEEPEKDAKTLRLYTGKFTSKYYLTFGPLDGSLDMDERIIVRFTNNKVWMIDYHCANHNPISLSCERAWLFNGEKATNPINLVRTTKAVSD